MRHFPYTWRGENNVVVTVPVPLDADSPKFKVTTGTVALTATWTACLDGRFPLPPSHVTLSRASLLWPWLVEAVYSDSHPFFLFPL